MMRRMLAFVTIMALACSPGCINVPIIGDGGFFGGPKGPTMPAEMTVGVVMTVTMNNDGVHPERLEGNRVEPAEPSRGFATEFDNDKKVQITPTAEDVGKWRFRTRKKCPVTSYEFGKSDWVIVSIKPPAE